MLIRVGFCGGNLSVSARGLRRRGLRCGLRFREGEGREVHAKPVFSRSVNPRLGVNPPGQVVMQIRSFGHAHEERAKIKRICAGRFIGSRGALFGICLPAGRPLPGRRLSAKRSRRNQVERRHDDQKRSDNSDFRKQSLIRHVSCPCSHSSSYLGACGIADSRSPQCVTMSRTTSSPTVSAASRAGIRPEYFLPVTPSFRLSAGVEPDGSRS